MQSGRINLRENLDSPDNYQSPAIISGMSGHPFKRVMIGDELSAPAEVRI